MPDFPEFTGSGSANSSTLPYENAVTGINDLVGKVVVDGDADPTTYTVKEAGSGKAWLQFDHQWQDAKPEAGKGDLVPYIVLQYGPAEPARMFGVVVKVMDDNLTDLWRGWSTLGSTIGSLFDAVVDPMSLTRAVADLKTVRSFISALVDEDAGDSHKSLLDYAKEVGPGSDLGDGSAMQAFSDYVVNMAREFEGVPDHLTRWITALEGADGKGGLVKDVGTARAAIVQAVADLTKTENSPRSVLARTLGDAKLQLSESHMQVLDPAARQWNTLNGGTLPKVTTLTPDGVTVHVGNAYAADFRFTLTLNGAEGSAFDAATWAGVNRVAQESWKSTMNGAMPALLSAINAYITALNTALTAIDRLEPVSLLPPRTPTDGVLGRTGSDGPPDVTGGGAGLDGLGGGGAGVDGLGGGGAGLDGLGGAGGGLDGLGATGGGGGVDGLGGLGGGSGLDGSGLGGLGSGGGIGSGLGGLGSGGGIDSGLGGLGSGGGIGSGLGGLGSGGGIDSGLGGLGSGGIGSGLGSGADGGLGGLGGLGTSGTPYVPSIGAPYVPSAGLGGVSTGLGSSSGTGPRPASLTIPGDLDTPSATPLKGGSGVGSGGLDIGGLDGLPGTAGDDGVAGGELAGVDGASALGGMGGMPFMPPMGGMGGMGGAQGKPRDRTTWLAEDEEVWGVEDDDLMPVVIGKEDLEEAQVPQPGRRPAPQPSRGTPSRGTPGAPVRRRG